MTPSPQGQPTPWREPSTIVAAISALISLVSLAAAIVSLSISLSANASQKSSSDLQAVTSLSAQSEILQKRFKEAGIDDVPKLTGFFYLLGLNRVANTILPEFYQTQIREWCPITRQARGKLKIAWIDDAAFRQKYQGSPWFLEMLAKLVGDGSSGKGDCL